MRGERALRVLSEIMEWKEGRDSEEFRWLNLMSRAKYDGYQDYLAGARFIESLVSWLQQFEDPKEREAAYWFVREALIYVGPAEMQGLVDLFYPVEVERRLVRAVAEAHTVPSYRVWAEQRTCKAFDQLLRRTLFLGLSEGAHLDRFRRANYGVISHEQVLISTHAGREKWNKLLDALREDLEDTHATFRFVYLIDDFTASGTTFIRNKDGEWKGKLSNFKRDVDSVRDTHFDTDLTVCVHHYLATSRARDELHRRHEEALAQCGEAGWFRDVQFSFGALLPIDIAIDKSHLPRMSDFMALAKKYCDREDPVLNNRHFREGNTVDPALGFADCALPVVLEHNTPNNSVAILWAETFGGEDGVGTLRRAMRPLFRRRQRHT